MLRSMIAKNIIADIQKDGKRYGDNYDIWRRKIQYLLNTDEIVSTIFEKKGLPADNASDEERISGMKPERRSTIALDI